MPKCGRCKQEAPEILGGICGNCADYLMDEKKETKALAEAEDMERSREDALYDAEVERRLMDEGECE